VRASRLNHSCLPNIEWQIDADHRKDGRQLPVLSLRTKLGVKKGDELTIDYIRDLPDLEPSERRKLLQQEFGFLCTCTRCTSATPQQELEAEER